ncbi:MAG: spore coat protein CotJB [Firmicutes bacterium]|nr:spore coat protein CotJB [Bacillota bacterium]
MNNNFNHQGKEKERQGLLNKIMQEDFALLDMRLFLNTHPCNQDGIAHFNNCLNKSNMLKKEYENKFGPLCQKSMSAKDYFDWIDSPWPWERGFCQWESDTECRNHINNFDKNQQFSANHSFDKSQQFSANWQNDTSFNFADLLGSNFNNGQNMGGSFFNDTHTGHGENFKQEQIIPMPNFNQPMPNPIPNRMPNSMPNSNHQMQDFSPQSLGHGKTNDSNGINFFNHNSKIGGKN